MADGKKPYNPVLGETCAWLYQHADAHCGVTRMVCEQVSHHPPISAMHIHNESLGITLEGAAQIDAKFMGNSVLVPFKGGRRLTIKGTNEVYHLTYPSLQYRGVMLGPKGAEWIGKMEIRCPHTKLVAKLDFKPMGWLGMWGAWHRVEGAIKSVDGKKEVVGAISGCWDKGLFSFFLLCGILCPAFACDGKRLAPWPTRCQRSLTFRSIFSAVIPLHAHRRSRMSLRLPGASPGAPPVRLWRALIKYTPSPFRISLSTTDFKDFSPHFFFLFFFTFLFTLTPVTFNAPEMQWASSHAKLPIVPTPAASLPTDSLVVWCKVSQALRAKDYRAANKVRIHVSFDSVAPDHLIGEADMLLFIFSGEEFRRSD